MIQLICLYTASSGSSACKGNQLCLHRCIGVHSLCYHVHGRAGAGPHRHRLVKCVDQGGRNVDHGPAILLDTGGTGLGALAAGQGLQEKHTHCFVLYLIHPTYETQGHMASWFFTVFHLFTKRTPYNTWPHWIVWQDPCWLARKGAMPYCTGPFSA
eukprot:1145085-Pelagomonas_calceolata.AAC.1